MNLYLTKKSNLEENNSKDGEIFTKEVFQSFLNSSTKARPQNYVKFTYYHINFKMKNIMMSAIYIINSRIA